MGDAAAAEEKEEDGNEGLVPRAGALLMFTRWGSLFMLCQSAFMPVFCILSPVSNGIRVVLCLLQLLYSRIRAQGAAFDLREGSRVESV